MAETLWVYEEGDRFATIARDGRASIWQVEPGGTPMRVAGLEPKLTQHASHPEARRANEHTAE